MLTNITNYSMKTLVDSMIFVIGWKVFYVRMLQIEECFNIIFKDENVDIF